MRHHIRHCIAGHGHAWGSALRMQAAPQAGLAYHLVCMEQVVDVL